MAFDAGEDVADLPRRAGCKSEKAPHTLVANDWPGHEILDIPDEEWLPEVNDVWVSGVSAKKQPIYVASPTSPENLANAYSNTPTVFAMEYQQFLNAGYKHIGDYMVPPK